VEPIIVHAASFGVVRAFPADSRRAVAFPPWRTACAAIPFFRPNTGRSAERAAKLDGRRGALGHAERDLLGFEAP
jgi:hypothetical protein